MTLLKRLFGRKAIGDELEVRLFLEAMLITIAADGTVDDAELAQFMAQVQTREELQGLSRRAVDNHMQEAFVAIKEEGIPRRVEAIAQGLPRYDQRLAALGMALSIVMGDEQMADEEKTLLKMMQDAFGISPADMEAAVEAALQGNLHELLEQEHTSAEQFYIESMMLMAAADGVLDPEELDKFGHQLAHLGEFENIGPEQVGVYMERSLHHLARDGLEKRLHLLAEGLTSPETRRTAFRLALEMSLADGAADAHERALLKLLQEKLALDDDFVRDEIARQLQEQQSE